MIERGPSAIAARDLPSPDLVEVTWLPPAVDGGPIVPANVDMASHSLSGRVLDPAFLVAWGRCRSEVELRPCGGPDRALPAR